LSADDRPLSILHVFRAPVGGLFRHVMDLARGQAARGHAVGVIADSLTGGERAESTLAALAPFLSLGVHRLSMPRQPGPRDLIALAQAVALVRRIKPDVIHGHGAKGGTYARAAIGAGRAIRAYTPHGGSLWFDWTTLTGRIALTTEKLLLARGQLYLFESAYSAALFRQKIGEPKGLARIVHNGVSRAEFEPVPPTANATDLIYLGEMRALKGVDVLIDAIAELAGHGRQVTATLVGAGPDKAVFRARVAERGLEAQLRFRPPMPAREAFALGHVMVVPSRAESLPYVVLEAAAAGKPLIATRVGGSPEIFGEQTTTLVTAEDSGALAAAIETALADPPATAEHARQLRERVAEHFSTDRMVESVLDGYRAALGRSALAVRRLSRR
jgi:glycosyltransferase involved in cell wall biosynthesis